MKKLFSRLLVFLLCLSMGVSTGAFGQAIQGLQMHGVKMSTIVVPGGGGATVVRHVGTPVSAHASSGNTVTNIYTPLSSSNTVCASIVWNTATGSVTSVNASVGNSMTHAGLLGQGSGFDSVDMWCALTAGTTSPITFTTTFSFTLSSAIVTITEYSGVFAFGRHNAFSSGISTTWSDNETTQDANNMLIAAVGDNVADPSFNVTSGSQESTSTFNNQLIVADAFSSVPAPLFIAGNIGSHSWAIAMLELRATPATGGTGVPILYVSGDFATATAATSISRAHTPAATGNTICALINWKQSTGSITGVTNSAGNALTHVGALAVGNGAAGDIWCALTAGTTSSVTYTASLSITADMTIGIVEYSGVSAFGVTNHITSSNTSGPFSLSLTTQDNSNFVIGTIGIAVENTGFAVTTGTAHFANINGTGMEAIYADNTAANAGSVTIAGTTGGHSWTESLLELRSTPGSAPPTSPPILYVGGSDGTAAAATSIAVTHFAANASNTVCALINWKQTTGSISSVTNSAGNAMTHVGAAAVGNGAAGDIWCALTAGTTSSVVYTAHLSITADLNMMIVEYSGVNSFGITAIISSSSTAGPYTLSLTTQDANNYVIGTIGIALSNLGFNVTTGVQRLQLSNGTGMESIGADNTAATASSVTIAGNTGGHAWTESLLELRSIPPGSGGGGGTTGFTPTTTLTALTTNNTSASSSFTPFPDARAGVLTPTYEIVPGNTSHVDPHKMMYASATTQLYVNFLPWFTNTPCTSSHAGVGGWSILRPATGNHFCIGYTSSDTSQIHKQVNDIIARGYQGIVFSYEGVFKNGTTTLTESEVVLQALKADLEARCTGGVCPFHLVIMFDGSELPFSKGFAGSAPTPDCCTINSTTTEAEFVTHLKDDFCYLNKTYFGSSVYTKVGGLPMVHSFIIESGTKNAVAPSWKDAWTQLNSFNQHLSTNCPAFNSAYAGAPNNGVVAMYFGQSSSAFSHDGLFDSATLGPVFGAYTWEQGSGVVSQQTSSWASNISNLSSFYTAGQSKTPSTQTFGAVLAKFNDQLAGWSPNTGGCAAGSDCVTSGRMVDPLCARNWVAAWGEPGVKGYSISNQLPFLQVVTWNDWDEGTEIESGLDNCYSVTSPSVAGTTLSWTMHDSTSGSASTVTIDHFTLWLFDSTGNAMDILDVNTPTATSLTIPSTVPSGTWRLGVQMVGVNSVKNSMSPLVTYIVP